MSHKAAATQLLRDLKYAKAPPSLISELASDQVLVQKLHTLNGWVDDTTAYLRSVLEVK